jgi:hypothetical protein
MALMLVAPLLIGAAPAAIEGPVGVKKAVMLPCRFPEGTPMRLSLEQHFLSSQGKPTTVTVVRTLFFGQDAAGLFLDASPPVVTTSATGAQAARLTSLYSWAGKSPMRLRLDARGTVVGIAGEEHHWAAFLAHQRTLLPQGGKALDPQTERALLAYQALQSATSARRRAMLGGFFEPLVRHCGQLVHGTPSPDERTISFLDETPANEAGVAERIDYRIDMQTGLATHIDRVATPIAYPVRQLKEYWRLGVDPAPQNR